MTTRVLKLIGPIIKPLNLAFFKLYFPRFDFLKIIYQSLLIFTGIVLLFILILIKSKTAVEFKNSPLIFIYSIFVTTFVFSRLVGSLFYKHSLSKIVGKGNDEGGVCYMSHRFHLLYLAKTKKIP